MKTPIANLADFAALDPFFRIIEEGLAGLAVHHDPAQGTVVLEYASAGKVVATGALYGNHYVSVLTLRDREVVRWRDYLDPVAVFDALGWPSR